MVKSQPHTHTVSHTPLALPGLRRELSPSPSPRGRKIRRQGKALSSSSETRGFPLPHRRLYLYYCGENGLLGAPCHSIRQLLLLSGHFAGISPLFSWSKSRVEIYPLPPLLEAGFFAFLPSFGTEGECEGERVKRSLQHALRAAGEK